MLRCLVFLGLVLFVSAEATLADGNDPQPKVQAPLLTADNAGRPASFKAGEKVGIWIWHSGGHWLITSTGGKSGDHTFVGKITASGGKLRAIGGQAGERKGRLADRYDFSADGRTMTFTLKTAQAFDTVQFKPDNIHANLEFDLKIDGEPAPKKIFLGKDAKNPDSAVFQLAAVPPAASSPGLTADPTKKKK